MTLILALPAVDGAVLVSDTRKWFVDGSHVDGHAKIARYAEGLVTGSGSGRLLDQVAAHSGHRMRSELATLIAHTAALGILRDERAVWTMTCESCTQGEGEDAPSIGLDVFDGFSFRPRSLDLLERSHRAPRTVRRAREQDRQTGERRSLFDRRDTRARRRPVRGPLPIGSHQQ